MNLNDLKQQGISLEIHDSQLRWDGPAAALTPELRNQLNGHKPALVAEKATSLGLGRYVAAMQQAATWHAIERQLELVQGQYVRGQLTADKVQWIAALAIERARQIEGEGRAYDGTVADRLRCVTTGADEVHAANPHWPRRQSSKRRRAATATTQGNKDGNRSQAHS